MSAVRPRHHAVVPAAGRGARMGAELPKQYLPLAGRRIIDWTLGCLRAHPAIDTVVVALAAEDAHFDAQPHPDRGAALRRAVGGAERQHSVLAGLLALEGVAADDDWVLVHDAARPCLRHADLDRLLDVLAEDPVGGLLAVPVRDTMKRAGTGARVRETVPRTDLWHALTPQMFRYALLRRALTEAVAAGALVTDEAEAVERLGLAPRLVEGSPDNLKVTRPEDLALAERFLAGTTTEHA